MGKPTDTHSTLSRPAGLTKAETVRWELAKARRDGDCMITTARRNSRGYGLVRFSGKTHRLHRLALEVKLGRALEAGEQANHTCHRPSCINPDHLYAGSQRDNIRDAINRGTFCNAPSLRGEAHPAAKLTDDEVAEIRRRYAAHKRHGLKTALAREYGVTLTHISRIIKGSDR